MEQSEARKSDRIRENISYDKSLKRALPSVIRLGWATSDVGSSEPVVSRTRKQNRGFEAAQVVYEHSERSMA